MTLTFLFHCIFLFFRLSSAFVSAPWSRQTFSIRADGLSSSVNVNRRSTTRMWAESLSTNSTSPLDRKRRFPNFLFWKNRDDDNVTSSNENITAITTTTFDAADAPEEGNPIFDFDMDYEESFPEDNLNDDSETIQEMSNGQEASRGLLEMPPNNGDEETLEAVETTTDKFDGEAQSIQDETSDSFDKENTKGFFLGEEASGSVAEKRIPVSDDEIEAEVKLVDDKSRDAGNENTNPKFAAKRKRKKKKLGLNFLARRNRNKDLITSQKVSEVAMTFPGDSSSNKPERKKKKQSIIAKRAIQIITLAGLVALVAPFISDEILEGRMSVQPTQEISRRKKLDYLDPVVESSEQAFSEEYIPPSLKKRLASLEERRSFALSFVTDAVQKIGPSVVRVDTETHLQDQTEPQPPGWIQQGQGSGLIFSKNGFVLTNAHGEYLYCRKHALCTTPFQIKSPPICPFSPFSLYAQSWMMPPKSP
jgi:hypothetical protein